MKKLILLFWLIFLPLEAKINRQGPVPQKKTPTATVRNETGLSIEELKALENRFWHAHESLEMYLGAPVALNNMPLIGMAVSGGGFRATVAALGLLKGLEKIGLLDSTSYFSTLSGSTWLGASWLTQQKSLTDLEVYLRNKMHAALSINNIDEESIAHKIWHKVLAGRSVCANDIYGGVLGNVFLDRYDGNHGQKTFLADLEEIATSGNYPLPIFTAALGQTDPYEWAEFTPFDIGSDYLHAWIKPEAFGKKFKNGESFDKRSPEDLAYLLGLFGSAYALSCDDIMKQMVNYITHTFKPNQTKETRNLLTNLVLAFTDMQRVSPPNIYNFSYKLQNSPLASHKHISFIDAGLAINLPVPPLLRRGLNVYIICDASADGIFPKGSELKKVAEYAKKHDMPFPEIDFETISKKPVSIFYDATNLGVPTVIYIPNFVEISTLDFDYDEKEFSDVLNGIEDAIMTYQYAIKDAIQRAADVRDL